MTPPSARTRVFALLGDPVSHSLSPVFQNAGLRALGLDGVYVALRCGEEELDGLIHGLARAGGGGNVTVPHKRKAFHSVDALTRSAEMTAAVNTFWLQDGKVWGDNTDVDGVEAAISALVGRSAEGLLACRHVLMAGAGGAASAVLLALLRNFAEHVWIVNRSPERAARLKERWDGPGFRVSVSGPGDDLTGLTFDLAVNATSLGLRPGDPLPPTAGARFHAALDLVYSPTGETPWVRHLRAQGIPAADGTEMLLHQGAAAFRRWWNVDSPIEVMRDSLREIGNERR